MYCTSMWPARKTWTELLGEATLSEELNTLVGHVLTVHDERVGRGDHQEIRRTFPLGSVDPDLAVIGPGNEP